jgi:hypothetical protein
MVRADPRIGSAADAGGAASAGFVVAGTDGNAVATGVASEGRADVGVDAAVRAGVGLAEDPQPATNDTVTMTVAKRGRRKRIDLLDVTGTTETPRRAECNTESHDVQAEPAMH